MSGGHWRSCECSRCESARAETICASDFYASESARIEYLAETETVLHLRFERELTTMAKFVLSGDFLIGAAAFVAGVYFADYVKAPVMKIVDWIKSAIGWVKGKF